MHHFGKRGLGAILFLITTVLQVWDVSADVRDVSNVEALNAAADERAVDTMASKNIGGDKWHEMVKTGEMPKMTIDKKNLGAKRAHHRAKRLAAGISRPVFHLTKQVFGSGKREVQGPGREGA